MTYLLIAAVLTFAPMPPIRQVAQAWAIRAEIMDSRERNYIMADSPSFTADCLCLARRYFELADAPPLSDCQLFPDHKTCCDMLAFNRAYRNTLTERQAFAPARYFDYSPAINEVDRLYAAWDAANDAVADYYYVTVRRHALAKVREMIGPGRFYAGAMLPPVPLSFFEEIGQ